MRKKQLMKKLILLLSVFLCITSLQAQQTFTPQQLEVQQTVVKLFDALSARDAVGIKNHSTADITLFEYGEVWNLDTLIVKAIILNSAADFKRTNVFEFINTTVDKTTAWVTYRLQSVSIKEGKQVTKQWLETVTLTKQRKRWKVKHLHSTLIKLS